MTDRLLRDVRDPTVLDRVGPRVTDITTTGCFQSEGGDR
jgi:hypothetical protein